MCATSNGSYLAQMPSAERKSGIPDSVLIPAPVRTTHGAGARAQLRLSMLMRDGRRARWYANAPASSSKPIARNEPTRQIDWRCARSTRKTLPTASVRSAEAAEPKRPLGPDAARRRSPRSPARPRSPKRQLGRLRRRVLMRAGEVDHEPAREVDTQRGADPGQRSSTSSRYGNRDSRQRQEDERGCADCQRDRVEAPSQRSRRSLEHEHVPAGEGEEAERGDEPATRRPRPATHAGEHERLGRPGGDDRGTVERDGDRDAHVRGGDARRAAAAISRLTRDLSTSVPSATCAQASANSQAFAPVRWPASSISHQPPAAVTVAFANSSEADESRRSSVGVSQLVADRGGDVEQPEPAATARVKPRCVPCSVQSQDAACGTLTTYATAASHVQRRPDDDADRGDERDRHERRASSCAGRRRRAPARGASRRCRCRRSPGSSSARPSRAQVRRAPRRSRDRGTTTGGGSAASSPRRSRTTPRGPRRPSRGRPASGRERS